ncbi:MAG: hypothetical protein NTX49_08520 [Chlamydiae bacterium]|nr:hypothetical protein [Chlamydiota bacterium]
MASLSHATASTLLDDITGINWVDLKSEYQAWRSDLYRVTLKVLQIAASEFGNLAELNEPGVYHKMPSKYAGSLLKEYEETGKVPRSWVSQGQFPGIWCALFHHENTYSILSSDVKFLQIMFKADYRLFDSENPDHQKMWSTWSQAAENRAKVNTWMRDLNGFGRSQADRMSMGFGLPGKGVLSPPMPGHSEFYREYKFGAVIGYSDYMAVTIIDPECIETLKVVERS